MTNQDQNRDQKPGQGQRQQDQAAPNADQRGDKQPGQAPRQQEQGEPNRDQRGQQNDRNDQQR